MHNKMDIKEIQNSFKTINGQFFPGQLSSRLYMDTDDIDEKYLVAFHERFHYLQYIFTPYGHLKWGTHRSITAEIVQAWNNLTITFKKQKRVPIYEYMQEGDLDSIKILTTIYFQDFLQKYADITDGLVLSEEELEIFGGKKDGLLPKIIVDGKEYLLNGLDIIESFAKYEEAILGYLFEERDMNEIINPDILAPRYYIALYFFVNELGFERLYEFPIICELALAFSHLPRCNDEERLHTCHPGWRFLKIVAFLKENADLQPDIFSDESFWSYTEKILKGCEFEVWEELWEPAEKYAKETDLSMAKEMLDAIAYKKSHPWCLSYPMLNPQIFFDDEFQRFHPLFIIADDRVFYNVENVSMSELLFENEFQALALQICGHLSQYNMYPDMLQCSDNYFGIKSCKYWLDKSCDGHLCKDTELPAMELDESGNIVNGCMMEIMLNIMGTSIKEIEVGNMKRKCSLKEIENAIKITKDKK